MQRKVAPYRQARGGESSKMSPRKKIPGFLGDMFLFAL